MTPIKSFTTLEQSRKLAEILPLESADMSWVSNGLGKPFARTIPIKGDPEELCACWSLTALLSVLNFPSLTQNKENEWEVCVFDHDNDDYIEKTANNPVDACYEMIKSLHELNLL